MKDDDDGEREKGKPQPRASVVPIDQPFLFHYFSVILFCTLFFCNTFLYIFSVILFCILLFSNTFLYAIVQ